jgi:hypothetical protein
MGMPKKFSRRRFLSGSVGLAAAAGIRAPLVLSAAGENWGDLVGRFVYDGPPPERAKLKVDKDIECCGQFDIRDESLMVGAEGGLQNVFIYLRAPKVVIHPELAESLPGRVTLDNRNCIFIPHCLKLWYEKQEFHTINSDPVAQNVAFSPLGDEPANIILPVGGEATYKFSRKQNVPVPIACNYHPWESAYVLPRDNPYVDISAPDGTFRIARLPVGTLDFQVWQERVGPLETPQWPKGRFTTQVRPGSNDLGTIKIAPAWLVGQKP